MADMSNNREIIERNLPYWDDRRGGVVIPMLGIVLDAKDLNEGGGHEFDEATDMAAAAGKRLFTREEAYIIIYFADKINALLQEHGGDILDTIFWASPDSSTCGSWYVSFGSGIISCCIGFRFRARAVREL